MKLEEYQARAMETCLPSSDNFSYMFIGLIGEIGEFASKVAKLIRKEQAVISDNELRKFPNMTYLSEDDEEALKGEAGDILWELAGLCHVMGWNLEDVAKYNLDKLASRKQRGVIEGNGDRR